MRDSGKNITTRITLKNPRYLERAARESSGDVKHWLRYLRKVIKSDGGRPSEEVLKALESSAVLSDTQKRCLRLGCDAHTKMYKYIVGQDERHEQKWTRERIRQFCR